VGPTRLVIALTALAPACKSPPRSEDAVARATAIEPELAAVRQLSLDTPVPAAYQSAADFRGFMHRRVAGEAAAVTAEAQAYIKLGLIPATVDLGHAVEDAYVTQAAAYYDPHAKRFFIVMPPQDAQTRDILCAHELTHALQDQHFDLTRYLRDAPNADARLARRFVVEGDAMLASIVFLVAGKTHVAELAPGQIRALRGKLEELANLPPKAMAAALKQQASSAHMDPQLAKALDAFDSIPPAVLVPLLDSYMKGALVALDAYERRGWASVDALFTDPPESTEQVLHPAERLVGHRDRPHAITLPSFEGYAVVWSDVLGELEWSIYFTQWKHAGDGNEAVNWGGDRYAVLRGPDGKLTAVIATEWDTEYDAMVFYNAYLSTVTTRYGGSVEDGDGEALVTHGDDATWMMRDGDRVYIVDGDDDLGQDLLDGTTFD
jgi:hypothetical protein